MKIIQIAAEFAPLAKVGGLGEVIIGLSRELSRLGQNVEVILPKYDSIDLTKISHLKMEVPDFKCVEKGLSHPNTAWSGISEECEVRLLEARHPAGYFHRGKIYGCPDDAQRFLYFSKACLEYLTLRKEPIDLLHLHDWHAASVALLAKDLFQLPIRAILLTLHNAEYQGLCAPWDLDAIGLSGKKYLTAEKLQDDDPKRDETINLLKGGIVYSDAVNAVSPSYAKEILSPANDFFLSKTLQKYQHKLSGILNGIDEKLWDPNLDPALSKHYSAQNSIRTILEGKKRARETLQKKFSLDPQSRPWIGSITRLVPQKGPELIEEALREALRQGATFFLLGSSPIPSLQAHFDQLKEEFKGHPRVHLHYEYEESLAHELYAALDFLLAPSLIEPCGLTQLIAMRYGTVPIVRKTGGLKDTVFDAEDGNVPIKKRNGFVFESPTKKDLLETIQRAIHHFRTDPFTFQTMIQRNMGIDFSWRKPTQNYLRLYEKIHKELASEK